MPGSANPFPARFRGGLRLGLLASLPIGTLAAVRGSPDLQTRSEASADSRVVLSVATIGKSGPRGSIDALTTRNRYDDRGERVHRTVERDFGADGSVDELTEPIWTYDLAGRVVGSSRRTDLDGDGSFDSFSRIANRYRKPCAATQDRQAACFSFFRSSAVFLRRFFFEKPASRGQSLQALALTAYLSQHFDFGFI